MLMTFADTVRQQPFLLRRLLFDPTKTRSLNLSKVRKAKFAKKTWPRPSSSRGPNQKPRSLSGLSRTVSAEKKLTHHHC